MSIILDALRRGRGRTTLQSNPNTAQTDAVLQTLGYSRYAPESRFDRLKRFTGYLAAAIALAIALWAGVVWITQTYLSRHSVEMHAPLSSSAPGSASTERPALGAPAGPLVTVSTPASLVPPASAPVPPPVTAPQSVAAHDPLVAQRPAPMPAPPMAISPSAMAPQAATAAPPPAGQPIVQNSQRPDVPRRMPTPPSGAPSRPPLSTSAGTSTATIITGDDHFRRAVIYQRQGDFENALFHYKQLLQRDDLNAEAHNNLGLLYRDKGLLDDAATEFRLAIAIEPRYARARNNLGVVYLNQGKLDAAASEFHAALGVDPKNVESLVNLSTVQKQAGRRDEARSSLVRALEIDLRNAEAHYNFALLEDEAGNTEQALVHYRAFLHHGAAGYAKLVEQVRTRVEALAK